MDQRATSLGNAQTSFIPRVTISTDVVPQPLRLKPKLISGVCGMSRKRNLSTVSNKISGLALKLSNKEAVNKIKLVLTLRCCGIQRAGIENSIHFSRIYRKVWISQGENTSTHSRTVVRSTFGGEGSLSNDLMTDEPLSDSHVPPHSSDVLISAEQLIGLLGPRGTLILGWLKSGNLLLTDICWCTGVMCMSPSDPSVSSGVPGFATGAYKQAVQIRQWLFYFLSISEKQMCVFQHMRTWKLCSAVYWWFTLIAGEAHVPPLGYYGLFLQI